MVQLPLERHGNYPQHLCVLCVWKSRRKLLIVGHTKADEEYGCACVCVWGRSAVPNRLVMTCDAL